MIETGSLIADDVRAIARIERSDREGEYTCDSIHDTSVTGLNAPGPGEEAGIRLGAPASNACHSGGTISIGDGM